MALVILILVPVLVIAADWLPAGCWLARALDGLSGTSDEDGADVPVGPK